MKIMLEMLKKHRYYMTLQEYRTIKGQILNGDLDGAEKGIKRVVQRRML